MRTGLRRRALAAPVGAVLAAGALLLPAAAASSREVVLPALHTNAPDLPTDIMGSDAGVSWHYDGGGPKGGTHYTTYAGRTNVKAKSWFATQFIGNQLISADGTVEDVQTGAVSHLALHDPSQWIGGTGAGGWLEFHPAGDGKVGIDRYQAGQGLVATYPPPPVEGADPPYGGWTFPLSIDAHAALFYSQARKAGDPTGAPVSSVTYLDFGTGHYTVLDQNPDPWLATFDATWLAWCRDSHTLLFAPRVALSLQRTIAVTGCGGVALSRNNVAVMTSQTGSDHKRHTVVLTGPLLGSLTEVTAPIPVGYAMPAANGDFAVNAGSTAKDAGVYHLAAGSSSLGPPIVLWGAATAVPHELVASNGHLYTGVGNSVEQRLVHVSGSGSPSYGGATWAIRRGGVESADGARTARVDVVTSHGKVVWRVVVQDGTKVVLSSAVPDYSYDAVVSGSRVLVPHTYRDPVAQPWGGGAVVIDLKTGRRTAVPETSALSGSRIAYLRPDGEVRVRDLVSGRERVVRPAGYLPRYTRPLEVPVEISGDWVLWVVGDDQARTVDAAAVNLATGSQVTLTHALRNVWALQAPVQLVAGRIAWIDYQSRTVHVMSLTDRRDHTVGTALKSRPDWLALTDRFLAWVASDTRRHVLAL